MVTIIADKFTIGDLRDMEVVKNVVTEGVDEIYYDTTDYDETSPYDYSEYHGNYDDDYLNEINTYKLL